MEIADLNHDERTALVGLMKLVVMSDGNVTEDELEHVETLVDAFGEGALDGHEADLLDWLSKAWNIKIEIADGIA